MVAITHGAGLPILRPLIAYDKTEIMQLARRIGTFDISTHDAAECSFLPNYPVTSAKLDILQEIISRLE